MSAITIKRLPVTLTKPTRLKASFPGQKSVIKSIHNSMFDDNDLDYDRADKLAIYYANKIGIHSALYKGYDEKTGLYHYYLYNLKNIIRTHQIKELYIHGYRWFDGFNTYHTVSIDLHLQNNVRKTLKTEKMVHGYDSAYLQTAEKLLTDNGFLKDIGSYRSISSYCLEFDIIYSDSVSDVKKKDLFTWL